MTRPSGARCSSVGQHLAPSQARSVDLEDGVEAVGRGLVRAEEAEGASGCASMTSRRKPPRTRGRLAGRSRRARARRRRSRGSRAGRGRAAAAPPLACGLALMRRVAGGRQRGQLGPQARPRRRTAPRAVAAHPLLELLRGAPGCRARRRAAPGASARCPRPAGRRPLRAGPALGRAQHDHRPARAASVAPPDARRPLDRGDLVERLVHAPRPSAGASSRGSSPVDDDRARSRSPRSSATSSSLGDAREDRRVGDLVAVEVQDRQHGAVACRVEELVRVPAGRQRPGLRLAVADDAEATIRSGLSNAAPKACESE